MGMAYRAPDSNYTRHYYVGEHAIKRLRERRLSPDDIHRGEHDLANLIDWATHNCVEAGYSIDILDDGEPATLVPLVEALKGDLWAIVKPDRRNRDFDLAVTTLLDGDMVARSWKNGKWKWPLPKPTSVVVTAAAEPEPSVNGVEVAVPESWPLPPKVVPETLRVIDEGERLIQYRKEGKLCYDTWASRDDALHEVERLRLDPRATDVRLWRPVKLRVAITEDD